ncbi:MAG: hypothetical protein ABI609_04815 [Acidobacteriota bacterium]
MLPHKYPFKFVDGGGPSGVTVLLSASSPWFRGEPSLPLTLAIEILAQASHVLLGGGDAVLLAGVEGAELLRPIQVGDDLLATAELAGRFGTMLRVNARLQCQGEVAAKAILILVGTAPPA